jgi:hypothetical protein
VNRYAPIAGATVAILLLAGGGYGWRHNHVRSPEYTLHEIKTAVADKNRLRFERFVDVETLSAAAINEIFAKAALETVRESDSGFGLLGSLLGAQTVDALKPAVTQELRSTLLRAVENGKLAEALGKAKPDSVRGEERKLDLALIALSTASDQMRFQGVGEVVRELDVATVGLSFHNELLDTTLVLRLRMERHGERWKVTRPDNLSDYLDDIQKLQERHLAQQNRLMRERIASTVRIGPLKRRVERVGYFDEYVHMSAEVENIGAVRLDSLILRVADAGEVLGRSGSLILLGALAPGEKGTAKGLFDYNQFIEEHRTLRFGDGLQAEVWLLSVLPAGRKSETLGEYLSWSDYLSRRKE